LSRRRREQPRTTLKGRGMAGTCPPGSSTRGDKKKGPLAVIGKKAIGKRVGAHQGKSWDKWGQV